METNDLSSPASAELASFAAQLHNRRRMKRLSLRALQEAIGGSVSHEMLARYERGVLWPREEVKEALCRVLGIYLPAAYRPLEQLQRVQFRCRYRLPQKEQDAIIAAATEHFNLYLEAEHRLGDSRLFIPPFAEGELSFDGDTDVMEDVADELRLRWQLGFGPLPNLSYLLECKGIKIHETDCENMLVDGFSAEHAGQPLICLASWLNANVPRKRMTLAHELGHILFPTLDAEEGSEEEYYIAHFAGAFLVPRRSFTEAFGDTPRDSVQLGELIELKRYFGASIKALMVRAWQLGLVSEEAHKRFRAFYAKHRYLDKEPGRYDVPDRSERYAALVAKGVLRGCISQEEAVRHFGMPDCSEMNINVI